MTEQTTLTSPLRLLLVDDDDLVRSTTAQWLRLADYQVEEFSRADALLQVFVPDSNVVIITDIRMSPVDGLSLMAQIHERDPAVPIILITGHGDIDTAVSALRNGAFDFLEKPFNPNRLLDTVGKAQQERELSLRQRNQARYLSDLSGLEESLIGQCEELKLVRQQIATFAAMDANVIVYGDTGCGKELVAQALHQSSHRASNSFVAINCAAIPAELFESELFGHEAGAFTNAVKKRVGKLEQASGGTLFLDEIESMPVTMQIKLLRVLQEHQLERVGGNQSIDVDLRVVAAAKTDLQSLHEFRQDLFFRLNVSQIHLPTLRSRGSDIELLFDHFCRQAAEDKSLPFRAPSPMDYETLALYSWPGNVRELKNVALRFALEPGTTVARILNGYQVQPPSFPVIPLPLSVQVQEYERGLIEKALQYCHGNIQETLERLQLPRRTLNQKMQKYGLNRSDYLN